MELRQRLSATFHPQAKALCAKMTETTTSSFIAVEGEEVKGGRSYGDKWHLGRSETDFSRWNTGSRIRENSGAGESHDFRYDKFV